MENQSGESLLTEGTFEGEAPGLAGIVGRMRLMVGDQALGVLDRRQRAREAGARRTTGRRDRGL